MLRTRLWLGIIGIVMVGGLAAPAQAQTTLRYKFSKGDKLDYLVEQKIVMKMSIMGNDIKMDMVQKIDMSWNVLSVDSDGNAKMVQKFDRFRFTMDGPTGKIDYDSKEDKLPEGPIGQLIGPIFKAMAGTEISLTMTPRGESKDVKISEEFVKKIKETMVPGLGDMFSEESLKQMASQGGVMLPQEPVTKGKTWDQKLEVKTPLGKTIVSNAYTYDGEITRDGKKLQAINVKPSTKIESDPNAQAQVKVKSVEGKGTSYFDNSAGRIVETTSTQETDQEISANGMTIGQTINQTTTMKLQTKTK
jgi:hypothetical protein